MKDTVVILLLFIGVLATQGLECYNCYYQDSNFPIGFNPKITEHPSCQRGSTPDESLKVDCSEVSFGGGGEGDNVTYTCMDLSMDGIFILSPTFHWNGTIRYCVASEKGDGSVIKEECLDGMLGRVALQSSVPEIQRVLNDEKEMFNPWFTHTHVCNCNDELCNRDQ